MVRTFRTGCNARPVEKANMAFSIAGIRSSHRSTCCTSDSSRCTTGMGASSTLGCHDHSSSRMHPEREGVVKSLRKKTEKTPKDVGPAGSSQPTSQSIRQAGKPKTFFEPCTILWTPERYSISQVGDPVQWVGGT